MYCRSSGEKRKGKLMKWLLIPLCIRSFQREYFIRRKNDDKKEGNGNDCEMKKSALLGLRVGKLFFDSIIFFSHFFHLAGWTFPHHHSTLSSFFFMFFSLFSFHSNENHLNIIVIFFFFLSERILFSPSPACTSIQFAVIQNGWIFSLFLLSYEMNAGNCCCKGIYG